MATNTAKLALRKPDTTDLVNVLTDLNETFDKIDKLSRGELAFGEVTVDSAGFTVATDLFNAGNVTLVAGQRILVQFDVHFKSTVAGDMVAVEIRQGANVHKSVVVDCRVAGVSAHAVGWVRLNLGAGLWTPRLVASRLSGTGVITLTASALYPAQMVITDLGQA